MRKSNYNILIKSKDKFFIINSLWGTIDEIDDDLFEIFNDDKLENLSGDEINNLRKRGYITKLSSENESIVVRNIITNYFDNHYTQNGHEYLIVISYNCSFRCSYCFEKHINAKGKDHLRQKISFDMIDNVMEAVLSSPPKKKIITVYGGEPLMTENREEVLYIIKKLPSDFKLSFITNGLEINNYLDVITCVNTSSLQITVDGSEHFHNKVRISNKNNNSFLVIMDNIQSIVNKGIRVGLRVNCTKENIIFLDDLHMSLQKYSFYKSNLFSISYSPIINFSSKIDESELSLVNFVEFIDDYNAKAKAMGFILGVYTHNHIKEKILTALKHGKPLKIQPVSCNAYVNTFIYDPFGRVYPCWNIVDDVTHSIEEYYPRSLQNGTSMSLWRNRTKVIFDKCLSCQYVLYCGGGCGVKANKEKGNFNEVSCDHFPLLFEKHFLSAYNMWKSNSM